MSELFKALALGLGKEAVRAIAKSLVEHGREPNQITLGEILAKTLSDMDQRRLRRAIVSERARHRARNP